MLYSVSSQEGSKEPQLTPQERVDSVRTLWESLSQEERSQLLSVDLQTLKERAKQLADAVRHQAGERDHDDDYVGHVIMHHLQGGCACTGLLQGTGAHAARCSASNPVPCMCSCRG